MDPFADLRAELNALSPEQFTSLKTKLLSRQAEDCMKKIADIKEPKVCRHPSHDPPSMIVLKPGVYKHTCPACGHEAVVMAPPKPTL